MSGSTPLSMRRLLQLVEQHGRQVTLVEILKRTRAHVERGWTQHLLARDAVGAGVAPTDTSAVRFCLSGALQHACGQLLGPVDVKRSASFRHCRSRLEGCMRARYPQEWWATLSMEAWNDRAGRQQSEVLALIEETIACLK